jgi:transcription-repair coupling factor (superfamily II helicase)
LELKELIKYYTAHPSVVRLREKIAENSAGKLSLKGLTGSSAAVVCTAAYQIEPFDTIAILNDREEAAYFYDDLNTLGLSEKVLFFPSSYRRSIVQERIESENIIFRTEVLNKLVLNETGYLVVTYPEAIMEKVISESGLSKNTLHIRKGEKLSISFINEVLFEYGFERVEFVYEPGQYSMRGSIIDIFSFSNEDPYRIDFFGDEVDSIRTFDIEDQISKETLTRISIIPNIQEGLQDEKRVSIFEFLDKKAVIAARSFSYVSGKIKELHEEATEKMESSEVNELIISGKEFKSGITPFTCLEFGPAKYFNTADEFVFNTSKQPVFNKNFDLLGQNLKSNRQKGYRNILLTSSPKQIERLHAIFDDKGDPQKIDCLLFALNEGFIDHDLLICCYTDHQIFERYHRFKLRSKKSSRQAITLKELSKLHPGDFVVHIDHGVGKFAGLVKTEVNGNIQEAIRLVYRDNDSLLVSIHSLHRIAKYKGKEGQEPSINKLGTAAWQNLKTKTKNKVKDIARELIALYAKRKMEDGFAFSADSYLQEELEASFIYEDTPDQLKATYSIKEDMEKPMPMDRLICGDVGFGKTEVAIRAAFKAVADSKQVAVLVPTTILALQHYKTFSERLKDYPCNVQYISRLRPTNVVKDVLKDLSDGKVDIIIGTHKLIGKDVKFKDLGLLIVDEEQHFGVSVKEKLKQLKVNVDTLTLTATPIPRTLQFSLMGARDLSIINTPPPNRYPINTEVHLFSEEIIRDAINYEISRGGQAFFINNRVQNIYEVELLINRLCPGVRTVVGHGQMDGNKLEKVMFDFVNGDYDVLIATTIIESGLDIPNTNTIIINNAQNFGLSELHQLRGRVGRSNKKAFCYLLAPPLNSMSAEARRRLQAIEEFSEIGSGFNIAMQDLDIRGAGNMLGGEQSGFIADIGFEAYHRILNEAMMELKTGEFQDLFEDENHEASGTFLYVKYVNDCNIDTDLELLFPDEYIASISERMLLYRELDNMEDETMLQLFEKGLVDRFGPIPESSRELINVVRLRWTAISLNIERIILKESKMICYMPSDPASKYYQTSHFQQLMQWIVQNPSKCRVKEGRGKLSINFSNVGSLHKAVSLLTLITEKISN